MLSLSSLDLLIVLVPFKWLERSVWYLPITLFNIVFLKPLLCLLNHRSLANLFRNLTFMDQLSLGELFLSQFNRSSNRMERFLAVEKAALACISFLLTIGFLYNLCLTCLLSNHTSRSKIGLFSCWMVCGEVLYHCDHWHNVQSF